MRSISIKSFNDLLAKNSNASIKFRDNGQMYLNIDDNEFALTLNSTNIELSHLAYAELSLVAV